MLPQNITIEGRDEILVLDTQPVPVRVIEVNYRSFRVNQAIDLLNACDPFVHELPVWISKAHNHMMMSKIRGDI